MKKYMEKGKNNTNTQIERIRKFTEDSLIKAVKV